MSIRYLNTDLDLVAGRDLVPLANALEARGVSSLFVTPGDDGRSYATFETDNQYETPESNISAMLAAIESLDENVRALWSECSLREFNIGYDCGYEPWAFNNGLTNATLLRIANAGASLRITLYPPDACKDSPEDQAVRNSGEE